MYRLLRYKKYRTGRYLVMKYLPVLFIARCIGLYIISVEKLLY